MAGPSATTPEVLPYDAKAQAEWLRALRDAVRKEPNALPSAQRARIELLEADVAWLQRVDDGSRGDDRTFLRSVFSGFETLWGTTGSFWQRLRRTMRDSATRLPMTVAAEKPRNDFERDYTLFDRLSTHYGGQYRGAIVFSYRLAIVAVVLALLSRLAHEIGLDAISHDAGLNLGIAEFVVVGAIFLLYLVGYTPESGARRRGWRRYFGRGWRQRWLEYRLLAERFRFAELLRVTGLPLADAWRRVLASHPGAHWLERHGRVPGELWHERLFLARMGEASVKPATAEFAAEFTRLLDEQRAYHQRVKERRGRIAHRLHALASWCFVAALLFTLLHVPLLAERAEDWIKAGIDRLPAALQFNVAIHPLKGVIILVAGVLTGLAAAVHGTLATSEYSKLAEISGEMVRELDMLSELTAEKLVASPDIAGLAPEVEAFCRLVTEDASGWTLLLRDKDLPRGGH